MKLLRPILGITAALALCAPASAQVSRPSPGFRSGFKFLGAANSATPAIFVAYDTTHTGTATGTVANPASGGSGLTVQAGDMQLVDLYEGATNTGTILSPAGGGTSYTLVDRRDAASGKFMSLWCRVLTSADIGVGSLAVAYTGADTSGTISEITYRGPTTCPSSPAAVTASSSGTTLAMGSFTPAASSRGVVLIIVDLADATPASLTATGYTLRQAQHIWVPDNYALEFLTSPTGAAATVGTFPVSGSTKIGWTVDLGS